MTFQAESAHDRHDPMLIAAHAAQDLGPAEVERVEQWLRECRDCAALHADVSSISIALAGLPKTANAPRDFRLSPAQAARLRGGPWWRRLGRTITAPRGIGRPLATAFTTLGLVGLLIGNIPTGFLLSAGGAASPERAVVDTGAPRGTPPDAHVPGPAPTPRDTLSAYGPAEGSGDGKTNYVSGSGASPSVMKDDDLSTTGAPRAEGPAPTDAAAPLAAGGPTAGRDATPATSPVTVLAIAFLAVGLGLFAIRRLRGRLA
ncbi:MAG TPA: hypothetical protein VFC71_07500 [Candidatus Polarisedimenticolia bacterium]|nr:hypothetical protein [Candidatus Polarisedimenticolia bacterium]